MFLFSKPSVPCKNCRPDFEELQASLSAEKEAKTKSEQKAKQEHETLQRQIEQEKERHATEMKEKEQALQVLEKTKKEELEQAQERFARDALLTAQQHREDVSNLEAQLAVERQENEARMKLQEDWEETKTDFLAEQERQRTEHSQHIESKNREIVDRDAEVARLQQYVSDLQAEFVEREQRQRAEQQEQFEKLLAEKLSEQEKAFTLKLDSLKKSCDEKIAGMYAEWYQSTSGHQKALELDNMDSLAYIRNPTENDILERRLKELNRQYQGITSHS